MKYICWRFKYVLRVCKTHVYIYTCTTCTHICIQGIPENMTPTSKYAEGSIHSLKMLAECEITSRNENLKG